MTVCIGVTGGICSGKSTVTKLLKEKQIHVIDADQLGHRAYMPHTSCYEKLIDHFGHGIVAEDGTINRRALGAIVFSAKEKMMELNSIVWPEIRTLIIEELAQARANELPLVVVEAAVMVEAQWYDLFDQVWVVVTDENTAIHRLMARNQITEEQAKQRLALQTTNEERIQHAHCVVHNGENDSLEALSAKIDDLLKPLQ